MVTEQLLTVMQHESMSPQALLDKVTEWQKVEMVELHYLNCECWRCKEVEEIEKENRWKLIKRSLKDGQS